MRPPDPPLSDGVISLRPFELADAQRVDEALHDEEIVRWFGQPEFTAEEFIARKRAGWEDGSSASFAIYDGDGRFLGQVFVEPGERGTAGAGYWLHPDARGRGCATRAVRLAARWAFEELGIQRLEIWHEPENTASQGVAERAGFTREGTLRSMFERNGRRVDAVYHSLLPSDVAS